MAKNMEFNLIMGATVAGAIGGLAQMTTSMGKVSTGMTELGKKSKELQKIQKGLENFGKIKSDYNKINKDLSEATSKLGKLKNEYEKTGSSSKELAKKIKEQEKVVDRLNKQKERQRKLFMETRTAIEGENGSLGSYKSQLAQVNSELQKTNKLKEAYNRYDKRQSALGKVKEFGDRSLTRGIATGTALAIPVKMAMDVEESQADLRKMLGDEAKKYYAELRKLSDESPLAQTEVYEIAGALAQGGIEGEDLVAYTERARNIKVAFDMDTQAAGNFLAKTKEQLSLGKDDLFKYADTINYLSDKTATTATDLVDFSSRIGSAAKTANVAKEANLAVGTTLISAGTSADVAATGVKQLYLELAKGADTKRKTAAFDFLGLNGDEVSKEMAKDAEGTILKVLDRINKLNPEDKIPVLNNLFGEQAINSVSTLANNTDKLRKHLALAKEGVNSNAVFNEYDNRMKTTLNNLKTAKNKIVNSMADLGLSLTPTITGILQKIDPLILKLSQFIQKNPQLTAGIMKSVAGFAAMSLGIGGATKVFGPLFSTVSKGMLVFDKFKAAGSIAKGFQSAFPTLTKFGGAMTKVGGSLKGIKLGSVFKPLMTALNPLNALKISFGGFKTGIMGFLNVLKLMRNPFQMLKSSIGIIKGVGLALKVAFMTNPVGFLVGALVGLGAIFVTLYAKSKWFRNGVNNGLKEIMPYVRAVGATLKLQLGLAIHRVTSLFKQAKPHLVNTWNAMKPGIALVGSLLKIGIIATLRTVTNTIRLVGNVGKGIFQMLSSTFTTTVAIWKGVFQVFIAFFTGKWNEIPGIVSGVWGAVKSGISGFVDGAKNILMGFFNFFKQQWENIKSSASKLPLIGGKIGKNYTGTNYWTGGLTTVAERGAELIKIPGKPAFLAESEMLLNLPKGTQILNNSQTRSTLRSKVDSLKERINNLGGSQSVGGDNITIQINVNSGGNNVATDIAREVKRVISELENKKKRTAIV